ncbi:hypothetical protein AHMF7605_29120 [Adhaeribacter arboris]|uniref:Sugar-binding protein n=1 Tax=Adhaeribacter arboris TaxID=2072846 RepID=A0A2T2Y8X2_9BACT|nr:hypothetical protein [Adhaeribacter arboris]PSR51972.1 hypothetical protein AHMF7605_29120 [Adhaeribacter arboris]
MYFTIGTTLSFSMPTKQIDFSESAAFLIEILFLLILLNHPIAVSAQPSQVKEPFHVNLIPPSPEAAALAKYADIPVSLYSGTPQITIPLYEVKERELSLPISLNYHASGNKVGTIAPRTGLGWILEASGVITRTVRGWPDEYGKRGFLYQATQHQISDFTPGILPAEQQYPWINAIAEGCIDIEPDIFYFNFAGYTGKFMFNWDGEIEVASSSKLKITPRYKKQGTLDIIGGWEVVGENGTAYSFAFTDYETTQVTSNPTISCSLTLNDGKIPQSWYLSQISSATIRERNKSWIRFTYEPYEQRTKTWSMETQMHSYSLAPATVKRELLTLTLRGKHLSRITTSSGQTTIEFLKGDRRTDVEGELYTLGKVLVTNNRGRTIRDWRFEYSSDKILMLKQITEWGGSFAKPPYIFSYVGGGSLDPLSYRQDHWGFANENSAQTLIPATTTYKPYPPTRDPNRYDLPGANREPSKNGVLTGMLTEIQYPTGGRDVLEFEPHDYSFQQQQELITEITIPRHYDGSAPNGQGKVGSVSTFEKEFTLPYPTSISLTAEFTYRMHFGGGTYPISAYVINKKTKERVGWSPGGSAHQDPNGEWIPEIIQHSKIYDLLAGDYSFVVSARISPELLGGQNSVWATVNYQEGTRRFFTEIRQGGGIRIARLTRQYGNGNPDKVTRYTYRITEDNQEKSSGSLLESRFKYDYWTRYVEPIGNEGTVQTVQKFFRFSQNRTTFGTTQGSHVGYSSVTVWQGENGENGRTVYTYTSPRQVGDFSLLELPFPPASSYDYKRGLLQDQTEFDQKGALLRRIQHEYAFREKKIPAIKVGWAVPGTGRTGPDMMARYALGNYENILGYSRLKNNRETTYYPANSGSISLQTTQVNTYNENTHKQLVKSVQTDSENDSLITQLTYPEDYRAGTSAILDAMRNRHMANSVVEKLVWKKNTAAQVSLLSALKTTFQFHDGRILPSSVLGARISDPIITGNPYRTAQGLYEERLIYHRYDTYGNLLEHSMKDGMHTSYLWGENGTVVIAKVDHAKAQQLYHTSFEEDLQATTLQHKTGRKSRSITGAYTIPTANRPTEKGNYVLTYWLKQGSGGWVYKEKSIASYIPGNSIATETINGYLDEVRLYPKGAKMTTFTYEPLVGITSVTDANNVTVHYEYDAFNRLKCKRDQDGNLLECYDYVFQEEVHYAIQD